MPYRELLSDIHKLVDEIKPPDHTSESHLVQRQMQHRKWQLIHAYIRLKPFRISQKMPRSRQWQEAMNAVRILRDQETIDWLWQQSDVARNFEQGIQDMRPRRKGTCHEALLEYLRMREHKANVVLQWEEAAQRDGCYRIDSSFHARTKEILDLLSQNKGDGEDEHNISLDDPWLRS